ncbi:MULTISPECIES: DUF6906 family protein [Anaerostipes]|uniref:DUF6906 family protein n=1 Tax=Anaerostipes TaxID=207244 RepID=UPI0038BC49F5
MFLFTRIVSKNGGEKKLKQAKKLTRKQKEIVSEHRLNPGNWMALEDSKDCLIIWHKKTGTVKKIRKEDVWNTF